MQIFLFARDGVGDHIHDAVMRAVPETEVFSTMDDLVSRLRHPSGETVVAVLIAGSGNDLDGLRQMKWLLHDVRTILIVPDRGGETITSGYCLHPRYMGCLDDRGEEIAAVLCNMLGRPAQDQTAGRGMNYLKVS
jgi:hypothetical protein